MAQEQQTHVAPVGPKDLFWLSPICMLFNTSVYKFQEIKAEIVNSLLIHLLIFNLQQKQFDRPCRSNRFKGDREFIFFKKCP